MSCKPVSLQTHRAAFRHLAATGKTHHYLQSFSESFYPLMTPILRKPHTDTEGTEDGIEARMRQALGKLGTARPGRTEAPRRTTYQATPGAGRHCFR